MLTDAQKKFLELSKKYELLRNEMKALKPQLTQLLVEIGVGNMFQDEKTLAVYEVVIPTGTYVEYKVIDYNRTKLDGEAKGSLSMKKAEEAGFILKSE